MLQLSRIGATRLLVTAAEPWQPKLECLREKLLTGLEWSGSVHDSAQQLMLEHDPAQRLPRAHYFMHYQHLAKAQVVSALEDYQDLREEIGEERMDAILQGEQAGSSSLRVLLADNMLARDKLSAALRKGEERVQANQVECPA